MREIIPINSNDRDWTKHRYILWFGAYGSTYLMVWANHLQDALDECVDWLAEHKPGLLCTNEVNEEIDRLQAEEGKSLEEACEEAEMDTTSAGGFGDYLHSWEWGIVAEDPTRAEILALQGRAP